MSRRLARRVLRRQIRLSVRRLGWLGRVALLLTLLLGLAALGVPSVAAQAPVPGELFVSDTLVLPAGLPDVIGVGSSSGIQSAVPLPAQSLFVIPMGVAVAPNGNVYVVDFSCCTGGFGGVIQVDPATGVQTIVSDDRAPNSPATGLLNSVALAVAPNGTIYVADQINGIIRIDPATGQQTILTPLLPPLSIPNGIAVGADGTIFVSDANCCSNQNGGIFRIDPTTGTPTILTQGGSLFGIVGLTVGPGGALFVVASNVAPSFQPGVVRVDAVTGAQAPVPLPNPSILINPTGITATGGTLFVTDPSCCPSPANNNNPDGGIIQIDPVSGAQSVLTRDNHLGQPSGIASVPPRADLTIGKTRLGPPDPVAAGQMITYRLTVGNTGPSAATGVTLVDPLPALVSFQSINPPIGVTCTTPAIGASGTVTCPLGNLAAGGNAQVDVVVQVLAGAAGTTLSNTATVTANEFDPNAPNSATLQTVVSASTATPTVTSTAPPSSTPSVTPTSTSTATPSVTATETVTLTPSVTATETATPTASATPTGTATATVTATAGATATGTATPTVTATVSGAATATPTSTPLPGAPTATPTGTATPPGPTATPTATGTATATGTRTATPTGTPTASLTPTATATPGVCAPRPPVGVVAVPNGDGRLRVTLTANTSGGTPTNVLASVQFNAGTNALVYAGLFAQSVPFTWTLAPGTSQATFLMARLTPGQASTVNLAVTDSCGAWPTFVGGGASAF